MTITSPSRAAFFTRPDHIGHRSDRSQEPTGEVSRPCSKLSKAIFLSVLRSIIRFCKYPDGLHSFSAHCWLPQCIDYKLCTIDYEWKKYACALKLKGKSKHHPPQKCVKIEYCIHRNKPVKMRSWLECNEELGAISVPSSICHRQ